MSLPASGPDQPVLPTHPSLPSNRMNVLPDCTSSVTPLAYVYVISYVCGTVFIALAGMLPFPLTATGPEPSAKFATCAVSMRCAPQYVREPPEKSRICRQT